MIAVDTNLLVYAHRPDTAFHDAARSVMRRLAEAGAMWAIPWPCIHEFLATVTRPTVWSDPTPTAHALDQVRAWVGSPTSRLLGESDGHLGLLGDLIEQGRVTGAKVHDAWVAAICLGNGVRELWTADRDFSRFPQLRIRNPLIP